MKRGNIEDEETAAKKSKLSPEKDEEVNEENPLFGTVDFLFTQLFLLKENSDLYKSKSLKGEDCLDNFFYCTSLSTNGKKFGNITADDLGAYKSRVINIRYKRSKDNAMKRIDAKNIEEFEGPIYLLKRYYSDSNTINGLKRQIIRFYVDGKLHDYVGIIYSGVTKNTTHQTKPHGSSKTTVSIERPYFKVETQILDKVAEGIKNRKRNQEIYRELGDPLGVSSPSQNIRNKSSISNMKARIKMESEPESHCKDEVLQLYELQKQLPELTILSSGDNQIVIFYRLANLEDIVNFCCNKMNVMCMDTTFKIVETNWWVPNIAYQNQRLEYKKDGGGNPWWLAATLLHFRKDATVFQSFFAYLATKAPELRKLQFLGTDEEDAM